MAAAVLPLAVRSPSQLEVDVEDNRVQARWEFDRAIERGTDGDLCAWARRWGPSFTRDITRIEDEVASLEMQVEDLEREANSSPNTEDVEGELDDVQACITTALEALEDIDAPEATAASDQLKDGLTYLSKARKELELL